MAKPVPSKPKWPTEYVSTMVSLLGLTLTIAQRQAYVKAVEHVVEVGNACIKLPDLHAILMAGEPTAGQYRAGVVFCAQTGAIKIFPRATAIPQLVFSFMSSYRTAVQQKLKLEEKQIEAQAWLVAAAGRALHPFVIGNTRLFCLIENHIRQVNGLPWTATFRPKDEFHSFRALYIVRNAEFYNELPGA